MEITKLAIDLAKSSFHVCGKNRYNEIVLDKKVSAGKLRKLLVDLEPCEVFMEACASSNYWGRFAEKEGHQAKLIAPQHVKPYVTSKQKNDRNDTLAILEASQRPGQYFQKPKTEFYQQLQMILTTREFIVRTKVATTNHIRGLLLEMGFAIAKGDFHLKRALFEILSSETLSYHEEFILKELQNLVVGYEEEIAKLTKMLNELSNQNEVGKRLLEVPGVGPITAAWFLSFVGTGEHFKNGRQASACLGLVPRQGSTGGRERLFGITKQGNISVRTNLIHGARAYVRAVKLKEPRNKRDEWVLNLIKTKGVNKTAVAVANKNARILWAMVRNGTEYKVA